jgi:hypothetical protein
LIKKCPKAKYALSVVTDGSKSNDRHSENNTSAILKCANSSSVNFIISKQSFKPPMGVMNLFFLFNDKWIKADYSSNIFSPPRLV